MIPKYNSTSYGLSEIICVPVISLSQYLQYYASNAIISQINNVLNILTEYPKCHNVFSLCGLWD